MDGATGRKNCVANKLLSQGCSGGHVVICRRQYFGFFDFDLWVLVLVPFAGMCASFFDRLPLIRFSPNIAQNFVPPRLAFLVGVLITSPSSSAPPSLPTLSHLYSHLHFPPPPHAPSNNPHFHTHTHGHRSTVQMQLLCFGGSERALVTKP